jgi:hypothetical protein
MTTGRRQSLCTPHHDTVLPKINDVRALLNAHFDTALPLLKVVLCHRHRDRLPMPRPCRVHNTLLRVRFLKLALTLGSKDKHNVPLALTHSMAVLVSSHSNGRTLCLSPLYLVLHPPAFNVPSQVPLSDILGLFALTGREFPPPASITSPSRRISEFLVSDETQKLALTSRFHPRKRPLPPRPRTYQDYNIGLHHRPRCCSENEFRPSLRCR